jgi:hypothetical protein
LKDYLDIFLATNTKKLVPYRDIDIAINLQPGKELFYRPIYLLLQTELVALKEFLEENLKKRFIRKSKSPASTSILFVPKKDRSLYFCIDYRSLNTVTIKNRYPLLLITEIIDKVTRANYFSKIDLKDTYYRLKVKEGDK